MTSPHLALEGASYVLPDGRALFSDLTEQFDLRPTGLVGRNGAGKTVLARMLAGQLQPTTGRCIRSGSVYYLAQQVSHPSEATVASLARVRSTIDALERIEAGSSAPADFDAVGDRWDIRMRLQDNLERNGLGHLDASTSASALRGGEAMRISLIGAWLSDADFLILDEPGNHLDRSSRLALIDQLQRWSRGLLVVSHDRQLLQTMARIVELSSLGLQSYGGNYSFYAQCKEQERQNALQHLEQRKLERRREEQLLREQHERLERRQARGNKQGHDANQAKILLGRRKERSESSSGKLRQQHAAARDRLNQRVQEAAHRVEDEAATVLRSLPGVESSRKKIAELVGVELPFVEANTRYISLMLAGRQRVGVVGQNGCGKSTLLKVLARQLQPLAGTCRMLVKSVYLDQRLANLDPQRTVLEQMLAANAVATEGDLRMRLAQLGLDAQKIAAPSASLSGGERLKAALACVLYADPPSQLLLLDEPSNHLDLPSVHALEIMLRGYQGALVVVSHDDAFLANLALTDRLAVSKLGWRIEPW